MPTADPRLPDYLKSMFSHDPAAFLVVLREARAPHVRVASLRPRAPACRADVGRMMSLREALGLDILPHRGPGTCTSLPVIEAGGPAAPTPPMRHDTPFVRWWTEVAGAQPPALTARSL